MRNLYSRLVTNENARTEALVNLLERVLDGDRERNTRRFGDFVSRVLLAYATDEHRREAFVRWINDSATSLSVVTQYRIDGGTVPDIVIFNWGDPACVVEVKIDSPIGENQLEGYGGWLAERAGHRYEPALVLLTHVTPAPAGFTDRRCGSFSVALRSVASWNTVAEWFTELYLEEDGVDEPLKSLAGEYGEFLEEYVMATLDDVAIARHYWAQSHQRLRQAVENMYAEYPFPDHWRRGQGLPKGAVGIWKYHYPEEDPDTRYVYCGLSFKPVDENDETLRGYARYENGSIDQPTQVSIGDGFYAFVSIYAQAEDCRRIPGFTENCWYERQDGTLVETEDGPTVDSTGWWHFSDADGGQRHRAAYARICPLQDLLDADGRIGNKLNTWTHEALDKTVSLWNALFIAGG